MGTIRTGKFLDAESLATLTKQYQDAASTPVMLVTQKERNLEEPPLAMRLMKKFNDNLNAKAVAMGFPEPKATEDGDVINYGCDFQSGEILEWDGKSD